MKIAIIDIGSNAIRAVVYSDNTISAHEVYHERFRIDVTQLLSFPDQNTKHPFYNIVIRFIDIFKKLNVAQIKCVATAAFRDNPNALKFCDLFFKKYNIHIEILSGEQEAFLSASGLILGTANPDGIIADLGGGSLELAHVHSKKICKLSSLRLGARVIGQNHNIDTDYITNQIKQNFGDTCKHVNIYLVGGGFRIISKAYTKHINYPLYNLHNFEMETEKFSFYLETLVKNEFCGKKSHKNAIIVLLSLIEFFKPKKVFVSNYGLKEGVRFTNLPLEERLKDVIFMRCKSLTRFDEAEVNLESYIQLINKALLKVHEEFLEDIKLSLMFIRSKSNVDRNFYGHFLSHVVLMSDIPFMHKQRINVSVITSNCFGHSNSYVNNIAMSILTQAEYNNCSIVAKLIDICLVLDGPLLCPNPSFELIVSSFGDVMISTNQTLPYTLFYNINKKLKIINSLRNQTYT